MADDISVRDSLAATMKELSGEPAPAADPAPVTEPAVAEPAQAAETAAQGAAEPPADGAVDRDEKGRFKPRTDQAQASAETPPAADPKTPAAAAKPEPREDETIRVPHALPAPLKAKFKELPAEWRDAYTKQEEAIQAFKDEQAPKAARLNRYDEIIGPHLDRWRSNGLDEFAGIQTLIAAQNLLDRDPLNGIVQIARSYGYTPQHLAQAFVGHAGGGAQTTGAGGQPAPTGQPDLERALAPIVQQVQTLAQQFKQQSEMSETEKLATARAEVDAFRNDPANLYFENVREEVAHRIQSGRAATLKDAYEQAIWADPDIRPLLIAAQAPKPAAPDPARERAAQDQRKAAEAARASGSVTGAPAPGSQAPREPPGSVRDSIQAAIREHTAA